MSDREHPGSAADPAPGGAGAGARDETTLVELTAAAARGDEAAFESLHRRVGAGLRRLLVKRCGARTDLVDDLMQTTWAAVWNSLRSGRYDPGRAAITTFVYAVGNNAWLTHLRRASRDQGRAGVDGRPGADFCEPTEDWMGQAEMIDAVRLCLRDAAAAGLTEQEQTIVRCIAAGESDRGLARRLGISCSTVNVRKHAGLAKIREHLERRGLAAEKEGRHARPSPSAGVRAQVQQVRPSVAGGAA